MVRNKKPQKTKKIEIVFDPKNRREYLTGFRKRKQERRKKAKEELEIQVKEERRRVKEEFKTNFRDKFKKSFAPIPELQDSDDDGMSSADGGDGGRSGEIDKEYETEDVSVKIIELSTSELAKENNWIGENRPTYFFPQDVDHGNDIANDEKLSVKNDVVDLNKIPGMDIRTKVKPLRKIFSEKINNKSTTGKKPLSDIIQKNIPKHIAAINKTEFTSKKQLGKLVEKKTLKSLKHSKAFKIKKQLDRLRDKKKARQARDQRTKLQNRKKPDKKGGKGKRRGGGNERSDHDNGTGGKSDKKNRNRKRH